MKDGVKVRKTKTFRIVDHILSETYTRKPIPELHDLTKQETKTLVIARYGMLECGINYKNSKSTICPSCKITDNEDHRMNCCIRYKTTNFYDQKEKENFEDIYSTDVDVLKSIIRKIETVWNTRNAHGTMLQ